MQDIMLLRKNASKQEDNKNETPKKHNHKTEILITFCAYGVYPYELICCKLITLHKSIT